MNRRSFLSRMALGSVGCASLNRRGLGVSLAGRDADSAKELRADVAVIGGGVGGCAAALAAARNGFRVILTEETDWIGGQLSQQAVPPDEHPWIEQFGCTRSYRNFRDDVRSYYRRHYPLASALHLQWNFNPGNCSVSRLCHEPRVAVRVLEALLARYTSGGRLQILLEHKPISASVSGDYVESVRVRDQREGRDREIQAPYFIDATELGDLLPMTGAEYVTGAESQQETGEPHAPSGAQPDNVQAFTWCFAMDYLAGQAHVIERPAEYAFWRDYVPELRPPWPGKLLSWSYSHPVTLEPRTAAFDPTAADRARAGFWHYRRLIDRKNFAAGTFPGDVSLVNWPQNDYWLGNIIDAGEEEMKRHFERARQLSLSLLYWMQTEAPRPDGGAGWPGLRLRGDLTGTSHGLAKYAYIREARRIRAEFTVVEQHVGTEARMELTGKSRDEVTAEHFPDSVGIGSYRIDLHPSTGGDNYIDISSLPFEIPLGALLPRRMENLLPGCKNLGVTHITNGCYRLHPVEWNIGEAAGMLAAFCAGEGHVPRQVRNNEQKLGEFQRLLAQQGIEIRWPRLTPR